MRELSEIETTQASGGFGSLVYWAIRGGIYAYQTYSKTQLAYGAGVAAGAGVTVAAVVDD